MAGMDTSDGLSAVTSGNNARPPKEEKDLSKEVQRRTCLFKQLRKTKLCMYHLRGSCQYGEGCAFAHTGEEIESAPDLSKTCLCKAFAAGRCDDANCGFAHGVQELRSTDTFYKKTLCMWHEKGRCRNGSQCRFAHGSAELRKRAGADRPEAAGGVAGASGTVKSGATVPLSATSKPKLDEPMFVQPAVVLDTVSELPAVAAKPAALDAAAPPFMPPVPEPALLPATKAHFANVAGRAANEEVVEGLAAEASEAGPKLSNASWPGSLDLSPTTCDSLAPVIVSALEWAQNQLNSISKLKDGKQDEAVQAELIKLSHDIRALYDQLTLLEVQMQHHLDSALHKAHVEMMEIPYMHKANPFVNPSADYPFVDYGFNQYSMPAPVRLQ